MGTPHNSIPLTLASTRLTSMKAASPVNPAAHVTQPKRSYRISYEDLEKHFDQPLVDVARKFDVCTTFFKKICRQHGIKRWPFRKLKSLQRKMKTSNQMLLVPQPEKTHQVARSSPDLQWMLASRSQMGLFPPEQRPDDQQLFETRAGRVAEMIEISAGQRVATPTGQRGPVDAGHIVCWDNQADVLTEETPEDSVTNHGACSKVEWGADMEDEVEEELIVVLSAMIRKTRGFQNVTTSI